MEKRGRVNGCGLFDLSRRPNPVAAEYRALLTEFYGLSLLPDTAVVETIDGPATLVPERKPLAELGV